MDQLLASWSNLLPRPQRNRGKVIGRALRTFAEGMEIFLDALCAPDMHVAQRLQRRGNDLIGEATVVLAEITELDTAEEAFASGSPLEGMNRIGREARISVGWESSITELDAALSAGVGWDAAIPGMGLQSQTILLLAQNLFDLEAFTEVVGVADDATTMRGQTLVESGDWRRAHARAAAYLASGAMSMHLAISSHGSSDLEAAQSAVVAVATWRDGVLRHALATMLASSMDEYERLVGKSGGHATKKAASVYPGLLLDENLTPALRNAGGHAGLDLAEGGIRIGDEEFSFDEFIDKVLAYLETTMATFVGMTLAMTRLGADLSCDAYLAPRDRDAAVALFLGAFNLTCDSVQVDGDTLKMQVSGPEPDWMTLSAALSAMFPVSVEHAEIRLFTDLGKRTFTTSFKRVREYTDGLGELSAEHAALHLSAIVAASRLGGASPWPDEDWNRVVQAVIRRDEGADLRAWVKDVRNLRDFGREADQREVVASCESALAELRQRR
ncbi:hypothetical protein [Paenarthrobacter sp. PH39-S1]|uniref:hypothetical protein n=1 Tax=Paenarthrobacter sp. PH39-S1 TaxID=3046204 RepID=UPI0024BA7A5C|nr:hypothetical protein [Paenarthrobacter sp. PH39-S1]MDJ0356071.1 hypothetical protein [Paenarthrobacter sp. PH39-S1]